MNQRIYSVLAALLVSACTGDPGQGWAKLSGSVTVGPHELEERILPDGRFEVAGGYVLTVKRLELEVGDLTFTALHEGEEEAAARVALDAAVPLLEGKQFGISAATCENECVVAEQAAITGVQLGLRRLVASGTVTDTTGANRLLGVARAWELELPLDETVLAGDTSIALAGREDYALPLEVEVELPPALFDGVDWTETITAPTLSEASQEEIEHALEESVIRVSGDFEPAEEGEPAAEEEDEHGHEH